MVLKQFLPLVSVIALGLSGFATYRAIKFGKAWQRLLGLLPVVLWGVAILVFPMLLGFFSYLARAHGEPADSVTWPWWGSGVTLLVDAAVSVWLIRRFAAGTRA